MADTVAGTAVVLVAVDPGGTSDTVQRTAVDVSLRAQEDPLEEEAAVDRGCTAEGSWPYFAAGNWRTLRM